MKRRVRPLVLATGDKQFNYKQRHHKDWYKNHDLFYRNLFDYCMDHTDTGGVFDEECIWAFQESINTPPEEFIDVDVVINHMNKFRPVWRKLTEFDIDTGEEFYNGYILFEDYYSILCGHGTIDENLHKTSYERGIINSYTKHNIPFTSIRGLREYIPKSLSKPSEELSNSKSNIKSNSKSKSI
tara:strand:- start:1648 stop:2199 length:552 start_codon:yes stop_codon:yes gene_type:complete